MGACGSETSKKMGREFGQLATIEAVKQFIEHQVGERKRQIFNETDTVKKQLIENIKSEEKATQQKIQLKVKRVNERTKGGLDKAAALQRKSVNDLIGKNQVDDEFIHLKEELNKQFVQIQQEVHQYVDEVKQSEIKNLDEKKPHIQEFNRLSSSRQEKVLKDGKKKYESQVYEEQARYKNILQQKLSPQRFKPWFRNLYPTQRLVQISEKTEQLLQNIESMAKKKSTFC